MRGGEEHYWKSRRCRGSRRRPLRPSLFLRDTVTKQPFGFHSTCAWCLIFRRGWKGASELSTLSGNDSCGFAVENLYLSAFSASAVPRSTVTCFFPLYPLIQSPHLYVLHIGQQTLLHIDRLVELLKHRVEQALDLVEVLLCVDLRVVPEDGNVRRNVLHGHLHFHIDAYIVQNPLHYAETDFAPVLRGSLELGKQVEVVKFTNVGNLLCVLSHYAHQREPLRNRHSPPVLCPSRICQTPSSPPLRTEIDNGTR